MIPLCRRSVSPKSAHDEDPTSRSCSSRPEGSVVEVLEEIGVGRFILIRRGLAPDLRLW